jgi:hypothetical protein
VATRLTVKHGSAHHAALDPVINPGRDARIVGKFAYGPLSKDLQDEAVRAFVRPLAGDGCRAWVEVSGGVTDGDGRIEVVVAADALRSAERYALRLVVAGDLTQARGELFVVPPGRRTVVFDVDGTLTTGDDEIVEQVLTGMTPEMRAGADAVAHAHHAAGYLVVYVTGRPMQLADLTRVWLRERGFPAGPLLTAPRLRDAKPGPDGVGRFKRDALFALRTEAGLLLKRAYGNATTDICAYAEAGIDPAATFIVGRHGGEGCNGGAATQALAGYLEHRTVFE